MNSAIENNEVQKELTLLVPKEVSEILRVSTATVYNMIRRGRLKAVRLSSRITLIRRTDLEAIIEKKEETHVMTKVAEFNFTASTELGNYYTLQEICSMYNYSSSQFYELRLRYGIKSVRVEGRKMFPRDVIDRAIEAESIRLGGEDRHEWYSCAEIMDMYGLGKTQVRRFAKKYGVRIKVFKGRRFLYHAADWEAARRETEQRSDCSKTKRVSNDERAMQAQAPRNANGTRCKLRFTDWYTIREIRDLFCLGKTQVYRYIRQYNVTTKAGPNQLTLVNKEEWDECRRRSIENNPRGVTKKKRVCV